MVDSGATGNFIDTTVAREQGLRIRKKPQPYRLFAVNGGEIGTEKGMVTHETRILQMRTQEGHVEDIVFDVVAMGTHMAILGMPWLRLHNPKIDWTRGTITMSQCQCEGNRLALLEGMDPSTREKICATSSENEYRAQDSVLKQIPGAYKEYESLFREGPTSEALPQHQPWDHGIPIEKGKSPTFGPIYQLSESELKVLKQYIDENLAKGFIRPSTSSAASPILFVPKKDGTLRLCVDYRQLNSITIKDRYALPLINELQDRLQGMTVFTSLDMRGAYNLIRMKEGEEWKTAFRTRYGLFEYLVMPFGLTNAPATMQRMVNEQLHEYLDVFVVAYLDDILIFSKSQAEHETHVRKVLEKLRGAGILLKPEKCEFHKEELEFLGFIVGTHGVRMNPKKVEAVLDWPTPRTVKEIQSFLGFANFYRRFIEGYSRISAPLTELTRKERQFDWTPRAQEAFEELKERFTRAPVLAVFNPELEITVETDASDFAIGACLSQKQKDGTLRPIAYYSRKMTPAELNYDVHDKELLAIVIAFEQWRVYLEGSKYPVSVQTDHKNLTTFTTTKILNRRQVRWAEALASYNFTITYRKGSENARADALSRRQDYNKDTREKPRAILKETGDGLEYNHELLATVAVVEDTRLEQRIKKAYETDEWVFRINKDPTPGYGTDNQGLVRFKGLVYIPTRIRKEFVKEQHELPAHGHQGTDKTWERMSRDYYFPGMRKMIQDVVINCDLCNKSKSSRHATYGLLKPNETPSKAWTSIAFDFIVKLPASREPMTGVAYDAIWVIVERTTRYGYFVPYKESSNTKELAYAFNRIIVAQHGLPEEIITDRDKLFTSKFWTTLMAQMGAHHKLSTAFHPQTDGITERLNQTLEQYLRCYVNQQQDNWVELLPMAQFAYNSARNETTGMTPFYANYGYEPTAYRQPRKKVANAEEALMLAKNMTALHMQLAKDIQFRNQRMIKYANKKRITGPSLQKGDKVYLLRKNIKTKRPSNKLDFKKLGPFEILEKIGDVNFKLRLPVTSRLHPVFHVSLLEPAPDGVPDSMEEVQPENELQEYEVEEILDTRTTTGNQQEYLIKWKNFEHEENTWEPTENLNCPGLLEEFLRRHPSRGKKSQQWLLKEGQM